MVVRWAYILCNALCGILLTGQHTRLFTESNPGVEIPIACPDCKTHRTHISSSVSGMCQSFLDFCVIAANIGMVNAASCRSRDAVIVKFRQQWFLNCSFFTCSWLYYDVQVDFAYYCQCCQSHCSSQLGGTSWLWLVCVGDVSWWWVNSDRRWRRDSSFLERV